MSEGAYPPGVKQSDVDDAAPHDIDCACEECGSSEHGAELQRLLWLLQRDSLGSTSE